RRIEVGRRKERKIEEIERALVVAIESTRFKLKPSWIRVWSAGISPAEFLQQGEEKERKK
ncbi:hypothetical protein PJI17_31330, partial [Mycobacterium kansasii]